MTDTLTVEAPVADWFDPRVPTDDPYPAYARLRELGPIAWVPALGRYVVPTFDGVVAAEQAPEVFSASIPNALMLRALGGSPMLRKDDPDHAAERGAINPTRRPRSVTGTWSPFFERTVEHHLDRLAEIGPDEADLNRDYAAPVASQNLIDLLGFTDAVHVDDMTRWSSDYIAGMGNLTDDEAVWSRVDRSLAEVDALLDDLLPRLRREPDASVTSHLLEVGLPEEAVRVNVNLAISGGMNEPQHMVTSMTWALATNPDQLALVREDPSLWGPAFEESVRLLSPIGFIPRRVTADTAWNGVALEADADVTLLLAAANRDPDRFEDPDRFDVRRNARGHVGFGSGTHLCAGRWAAKHGIGEIAVPRLLEPFPDLRMDPRREARFDGWVFRGLERCPVTWGTHADARPDARPETDVRTTPTTTDHEGDVR